MKFLDQLLQACESNIFCSCIFLYLFSQVTALISYFLDLIFYLYYCIIFCAYIFNNTCWKTE